MSELDDDVKLARRGYKIMGGVILLTIALGLGLRYWGPHAPSSYAAVQPEAAIVAPLTPKFTVLMSRDRYLRVLLEDGRVQVRTGGSITWRTHNPAKLKFSPWTAENGGLKPGKDQEIAIFTSEDAGKDAARKLLFQSDAYAKLTLIDAIAKFAPKSEGFNPDTHLANIQKVAKVNPKQVMQTFSLAEQDLILAGVKEATGWIEGEVWTYANEAEFEAKGWK